jgi:hypothetical protein
MPSLALTPRLQISSQSFEFIHQMLQRTCGLYRLIPQFLHFLQKSTKFGLETFKVEPSFPHDELMQSQEQRAMVRDIRSRALQDTIKKKLLSICRHKYLVHLNKSWGLPFMGPSELPAHEIKLQKLHIIRKVAEMAHHSSVHVRVALLLCPINKVEVSTHSPRTSALHPNVAELL